MQTLNIALGDRSYPILIEQGIIDRVGEKIRETIGETKCVIVTDMNVAPLYLERVTASLDKAGLKNSFLILKAGEQTKSMNSLRQIYDYLCDQEMSRTDTLIALGGGVMGDLTGMAAATFLRGIRFVQVATTLLAQVDSSVGGKVAVDLPQGKNLVGAFYQPKLVLIDPDTLNTLTPEFWRDGLGEVVKYGCIGDEPLFALLEESASGGRQAVMARIDEILLHCLKAKANVVEQDEQDTGVRMVLNFGHTLGHAVEAVQHFEGFRHGEAVAVGMAMITRMSEAKNLTAPGTSARLEALLNALELPTHLCTAEARHLLDPIRIDKKKAGQVLRIIVLNKVGSCRIEQVMLNWFDDVEAYL